MNRLRLLLMNGAALLAALCALPAPAQPYPIKPIRIIVPTSPGGASDLTARLAAQKAAPLLGQQLIVDNRPGASGVVGLQIAQRAAPDGYTIILLAGTYAASVNLYSKPPYDLINDFTHITQASSQPYVLVMHPSVGAKTVKELVALALAKPETLNFAHSGTGGLQHLAGVMLSSMTGARFLHVPYKGGGPVLTAVVANQAQFSFNNYLVSGPHITSGRLRALAVTTARRSAALPEIPALAETYPGYKVDTWYGFSAPAKTPPKIIDQLHRAITASLSESGTREALLKDGSEVVASTPEQFTKFLREEVLAWGKLIKQAKVTIE